MRARFVAASPRAISPAGVFPAAHGRGIFNLPLGGDPYPSAAPASDAGMARAGAEPTDLPGRK
ncbi:MAG TPA: hypothetical protein PKD61_20965, partial [Polyangiaceae bacterium]|nr:hypothetical protein [Polyangiaceae bacterium]